MEVCDVIENDFSNMIQVFHYAIRNALFITNSDQFSFRSGFIDSNCRDYENDFILSRNLFYVGFLFKNKIIPYIVIE